MLRCSGDIFKRLLDHDHLRQLWYNSAKDPIYVALDVYIGRFEWCAVLLTKWWLSKKITDNPRIQMKILSTFSQELRDLPSWNLVLVDNVLMSCVFVYKKIWLLVLIHSFISFFLFFQLANIENLHQQNCFNISEGYGWGVCELVLTVCYIWNGNCNGFLWVVQHLRYSYYTPGIYAEGYIVFIFPFIRLFIRLFVRSFVCSFVCSYFGPIRGITSKFYVQATWAEYISPTTHQKAFIFGP